MRIFLALLASWLSAFGATQLTNLYTGLQIEYGMQISTPYSVGGETPYQGYPTNQTGYPVYCWYPVHGNFGTNPAISGWSLTNQSIEVVATGTVDLTNRLSGVTPIIQSATLNSKDVLLFDGTDDYLRSASWTSSVPFEVCLVAAYTNEASTGYILDGYSTTARNPTYIRLNSSGYNINANNIGGAVPLEKWVVTSFVYYALDTAIYTNNILYATNNADCNNQNGIIIGAGNARTDNKLMNIAEILIWQTNLTATVRSNIYSYLTNKYALVP